MATSSHHRQLRQRRRPARATFELQQQHRADITNTENIGASTSAGVDKGRTAVLWTEESRRELRDAVNPDRSDKASHNPGCLNGGSIFEVRVGDIVAEDER